ncbi:hypothetical protein [Calothrix sp. PCC 7507]|uniref:hypothetical protein n=1 Tax=Calothrix sp. PCC 7507 TaxID=99598 RepID=UPI00029ED384|nr:hypothetical protein [Calothrix sp. PCC 7507]AFY30580.1 hypothetical protein Cal7507_0067 [Calothrix sp. PCC 7507]
MAYNFHPDAKQELDDAVAYYDNISREMYLLPKLNALSIVLNSSHKHGLNYQKIQDAAA